MPNRIAIERCRAGGSRDPIPALGFQGQAPAGALLARGGRTAFPLSETDFV